MAFSSSSPMVRLDKPNTPPPHLKEELPSSSGNTLQIPKSYSPPPPGTGYDAMPYSPFPNTPPDAPMFNAASPPPSPFGLTFPSANSPYPAPLPSPQGDPLNPPSKLGAEPSRFASPPPDKLLHPRAGEKRRKKKTSNRMTKSTTSYSAASHFCVSSSSGPNPNKEALEETGSVLPPPSSVAI